ncbi:TraB/GumN family protein [Uliginosibacterium gangwonense]|uniref:TraB/GumN family protein n=1 Tax=Uliginosibacterium gangwonense TaxID=392736 RepID=UPI0003608B37|nr:TraB/GumN family protein [Uliginosibacterium gangwonense]
MNLFACLRNSLVLLFLLISPFVQAADKGRLPLWEARNELGTIYLYGSVHVCNASCFPLPEAVISRLRASDTLVVELDPRAPALQEKLVAAAMLPPGQTLPQLMTTNDWRELESAVRGLGVPPESLTQMRPWMAGTVLSLLIAQQNGLTPESGIDVTLIAYADKNKIQLEELETLDEQITAMNAGTDREQRTMLRELATMVRQKKLAGLLKDIVEAWKTGDSLKLDRLMRVGMPAGSSMEKALFTQRNARMAERIEAHMKQDPRARFVVVGVGHLVGANSVPEILSKHGYSVRQISADDLAH